MQAEIVERWRKLCELAAVEQDHKKLLELTNEINRLLEKKEQRQQNSGQEQSTAA